MKCGQIEGIMCMSISAVSCSQQNIQKPAFKGKWDRTEQGTPYYKTCSAMKIGGTLAGLSVLSTLMNLWINKEGSSALKAVEKDVPKNIQSQLKKGRSAILLTGAVAMAAHLAPAAYIDYKRNVKAKEVANYVQHVGVKNAVMNNDNIAFSNKGRAYYDSNIGAKNGAWLGALAATASYAIHFLISRKEVSNVTKEAEKEIKNLPIDKKEVDELIKGAKKVIKMGSVVGCTIGVGLSALGGWLLGKWSDHIANNDARKHV